MSMMTLLFPAAAVIQAPNGLFSHPCVEVVSALDLSLRSKRMLIFLINYLPSCLSLVPYRISGMGFVKLGMVAHAFTLSTWET